MWPQQSRCFLRHPSFRHLSPGARRVSSTFIRTSHFSFSTLMLESHSECHISTILFSSARCLAICLNWLTQRTHFAKKPFRVSQSYFHFPALPYFFFCLFDILLNIRVWNPNPCQFLSPTFFAWEPFYPVCTNIFQNDQNGWLCLCCGFSKDQKKTMKGVKRR